MWWQACTALLAPSGELVRACDNDWLCTFLQGGGQWVGCVAVDNAGDWMVSFAHSQAFTSSSLLLGRGLGMDMEMVASYPGFLSQSKAVRQNLRPRYDSWDVVQCS